MDIYWIKVSVLSNLNENCQLLASACCPRLANCLLLEFQRTKDLLMNESLQVDPFFFFKKKKHTSILSDWQLS